MDEEKDLKQAEAPVEETPRGRALLRKRIAERYPDEQWDDDDVLSDRVMKDYDDLDGRVKQHEENDKKLSDLFEKNPQSASFIMGMANGEDFLSNLQRNFGAEIVDAMSDPDKLEALSAANKEYLERVAKNKELEETWQKNMEGTLDRLQSEQESKGLSDDDVQKSMDALEKVVSEYLDGNISSETLGLFLKGAAHDKDVAAARREGEVVGRNASINEKLVKRKNETDGTPTLGGQTSGGAKGRAFRRSTNGGNVGPGIWDAGNFKRNNYE